MTCDGILKKLSAYVDGEIGSGERAEIESHLALCERCARAAREFRRLDELASAESVPAVAAEEWARLEARVLEMARRAQSGGPARPRILEAARLVAGSLRSRRTFAPAAAALAAAALLLLSVVAVRWISRGAPPGDPRTAERSAPRAGPAEGSEPAEPKALERGKLEDYANHRSGPEPEIVVDPDDGAVHLIYEDF